MPRTIEAILESLKDCSEERPVPLGRYDVVGRLGHGGMGSVYTAIDKDRGSRVALKTLLDADPAASIRLKREFRVAADLAHPNLAPLHELGEVDGLHFFTMALVPGESFFSWARREALGREVAETIPLSRAFDSPATVPTQLERWRGESLVDTAEPECRPPERSYDEIRAALLELSRGVAALHDVGLSHGDIKSSNILVDERGRVVLVDFGLSGPEQAHRQRSGTPPYMSPEQTRGPASDWYGVGVVMYRVLTGRFPFRGSSMLDLLFKKRHRVPPSPRELVDGVPEDLSALCLGLLRPEPEQRPDRAELLRVLDGGHRLPTGLEGRRAAADFVGRERELFLLEHAYGSARAGRMTRVHTFGPSGIGKSALLSSFLSGVADLDDALILRGRCYERETMPYKAFDLIVDELAEHLQGEEGAPAAELLPAWTAELATVFPALASVAPVRRALDDAALPGDAMELRRRAWAALGELLDRLQSRRTVVIHIDDLQWADTDSAQLLEELFGQERRASVLVILSFRPEARESPVLQDYFARATSSAGAMPLDVELAALPQAEAEELARLTLLEIGAEAREDRVVSIAQEAAGVPFFVEELAHFVAEGHEDAPLEAFSLQQAILSRVGSLPDDQRRLVEMLAAAGSPVAQSVLFDAAGVDGANLMPLLALRKASLVSWRGAGPDDAASCYHDRIRESVLEHLVADERAALHLALGRAFARRHEQEPSGAWVLEAAHHLDEASALIQDPVERLAAASLQREAGTKARHSAAFPLAFRCFERGIAFSSDDAWDTHYELALALHVGAAEAAYLSQETDVVAGRIEEVKAHARTALDQTLVWEVEIDLLVGRQEFAAAIASGTRALALLGVEQKLHPTEADVGEAIQTLLQRLAVTSPEEIERLGPVEDAAVEAAMRIQVRLSPVAYIGRPLLLPLIACNLVTTSMDRGLSHATPYALGLFGLVLASLEMFPAAHVWASLALRLLDRFPDRSLEAATRHLVFNFCTCWTVPLTSVLPSAKAIFDIGCRTGDFEYAAYGAHSYVLNASYSGCPLGPLLAEAEELSEKMRALGSVNGLHLHTQVERWLRVLAHGAPTPGRLDGDGFDEDAVVAAMETSGSRSGTFLIHMLRGLARFTFGSREEAAACFASARQYSDSVPATWHLPPLHQLSALASCARLASPSLSADEASRERAVVDTSLAALRRLAAHHPGNFAHRVSMVEAEQLHLKGDDVGALRHFDRAIEQARAGGWVNDVALANELAARCYPTAGERKHALRRARAAYAAWGAFAKAAQLDERGR